MTAVVAGCTASASVGPSSPPAGCSADNSVFDEMVRQGRIPAEEFQPDSAVREMANIVGGALDFIFNGHMHRRGYDQRTDLEVDSTANRSVLSLIGCEVFTIVVLCEVER